MKMGKTKNKITKIKVNKQEKNKRKNE